MPKQKLRLKILVISNYNGPINPVRPEAEIFLGLKKLGVDVEIMTSGDNYFTKKFKDAGIPVIDFAPKRKIDPEAIRFIRNTIRERGYDIIHLFNNKAISNGAWAAIGLPVKVVTYRGYTGNIHWYDPTSWLKHLHPRVDKIVCLADSVKDIMQANLIDKSKAVTINKGHRPEWYESVQAASLAEFNFPEKAFVVGLVANTRRMKGLVYLMEATKYLPPDEPIYLLMIGRGLETPQVKKILRDSRHKDKVVFAGFRTNALELIKATDLAVSSSIFGEATPKGVIEPMQLGLPVVITDIPGTKGMVENGKSGLVVPPKEAKALAKAITYMYNNPQERRAMAANGQQRIAQILHSDRTISEYFEFYSSLIERN